jgi:Skp family chaperone for outer membrane proteins
MRMQRLAVAGLALGISTAVVGVWLGGTVLAQDGDRPQASPAARIATIDTYLLAEKLMNRAELADARKAIDSTYQPQLEGIEKDVQQLDTRLTPLQRTPNDPQVQPLLEQRQNQVQKYQELVQKLNQEKEQLLAGQLGVVYREVREAAARLAQERGYTHVIANRTLDKTSKAQTAGDALQDMLARPMIVAPSGDDLTTVLATQLNVDLSEPAPAQPQGQAPAPAPQSPAPQNLQPAQPRR